MTRLRITPDQELATPEAIQFRIERLRGEKTIQAYRRIQALKLRLPADPTAALLPAIDASLLVSKSELDWGIPTRSLCGSFR